MKLAIPCILCFFMTGAVWAQYTSQQGFFTVDQKQGCAPFTLNLSAPTCDGTVGCDVDYEGTGAFQSVLLNSSHTYTAPGTYTITFVRGAQIDNLQVTVDDNVQPQVQIVTCGNNRVSVSVIDNAYDQYVINYNDGTGEFVVAANGTNQHSYSTSGTKTITVRGRNLSSADNCSSISTTVNVQPSLPTPTITELRVIDNSRIRIAFDGQPDIQYRVEIGLNNSGTFQQIKTLLNANVDTIGNLRPDDNVYCFRVKAFDPCSNQTVTSNTICSANADLEILNNENRISWTTLTGPTAIVTERLLITPTNSGTSVTVANASSPYTDTNVTCGTEYCYEITMVYSNGSQSISLPKCGVAISTDTPDRITNVSTVNTGTGMEISWVPEPGFTPDEYSVFKILGGDEDFFRRTRATQAVDSLYTVESPSCYRISYTDVCGNESPSGREACPIILTAMLASNNDIVLAWTSYQGWENGVGDYVINKYDQDGELLVTIPAGTDTTYTDASLDLNNQVYIYQVTAIAADAGLSQSVSNRAEVVKDPNLFYPTSFTPNGDALNDIFNVYGQYITAFEMDIFNRWGELMYTTTDLTRGWDGNFNGTPMPEGTYTFVARITDLAGRNFKKSGSVLLLKKE